MPKLPSISRKWKISAAALILAAIGFATATAKPDISKLKPQAINVHSFKITFKKDAPTKRVFGKLKWRGGLLLTSVSPNFGGFSGLTISPDGKKLLTVSDAGFWMSADLAYEGQMLKSFSGARVGPLLKKRKKTEPRKSSDAESIALIGKKMIGGEALVSFERDHRIEPYQIGTTELSAKGKTVKLPKSVKYLKDNKSLEAIEFIRSGPLKGTLVVFPERYKDKKGDLKGWLIGKGKTKPITIKRKGGFDITGLAALPDGGLLLLERRFRFKEGVKMRIRRLSANSIKPNARLSGETLIEAHNLHETVDNMEGIAAHRAKNGDIIITLISDDNFNFFQRTLLMQFAIIGDRERRAEKVRRYR